jgi:hypothetical protein
MNNLEEISINEGNMQDDQVRTIKSKVTNLMPKLKQINQSSQLIAKKFSNISSDQKHIVDQIYNRASGEMKVNQKFLHDTIDLEKKLKGNFEDLKKGKGEIITPHQVENKKKELILMQANLIKEIEEMDFKEFLSINETDNNALFFKSFNKIWVWVMEVFFNLPSSYYYWPDFKTKALKKSNGAEVKRRMIIFPYKNLKNTELNELAEINSLHYHVVMEKFGDKRPFLLKFLNILRSIAIFKEQSDVYENYKDNVVEENDVNTVREEFIQDSKNKNQLCSIKYDVLSEMNNFLHLLTRELKPY